MTNEESQVVAPFVSWTPLPPATNAVLELPPGSAVHYPQFYATHFAREWERLQAVLFQFTASEAALAKIEARKKREALELEGSAAAQKATVDSWMNVHVDNANAERTLLAERAAGKMLADTIGMRVTLTELLGPENYNERQELIFTIKKIEERDF